MAASACNVRTCRLTHASARSAATCGQITAPRPVQAAATRLNVDLFRRGETTSPRNWRRAASVPVQGSVEAQSTWTSDTPEMSAADLKAALLDSLFGTERGLSARSEVRAEINELISQLEAKNPVPSPTEALEKLDGEWRLVYTSNSELIALLALSRLPFVTIGDITQRVDAATNSVENKVVISVPLSRTAFSTTASFEVRSPKRLQVRFEKGTIQTPQLLTQIDLPESVSVMGQNIDLTQIKSALEPINERVQGLLTRVESLLSQQPNLNFPIQGEQAQTWLLTTYLDEDTRITRGDGGSVFILVKEVSLAPPLLETTSAGTVKVPAPAPAPAAVTTTPTGTVDLTD